jgi:hypothetical protein
MGRYVVREAIDLSVEAIQWFPGVPVPGVAEDPGGVSAYCVLTDDGAVTRIVPGDWVVTTPGPTRHVLSRDVFARIYAQAPDAAPPEGDGRRDWLGDQRARRAARAASEGAAPLWSGERPRVVPTAAGREHLDAGKDKPPLRVSPVFVNYICHLTGCPAIKGPGDPACTCGAIAFRDAVSASAEFLTPDGTP